MQVLIRTLFISSIFASPAVHAAEEDPCKVYDTAAKGAMEYRQDGRNLSEALAILDKQASKISEPVEAQVNSTLRIAFVEAFKRPRYSTQPMKESAISDFRNDFYSGCLKAVAEKSSR
ncbi:hypothetical protein GTQ41_05830 [Pseudomonas sp. AN-B15]|uniref:hypothetical protein n=1 Tax=Pseudomonas sp. AN-B15 TaxID=2697023 RepID=UPI001C2BBA6C|nr:hypothetical protein [Pseudomonas sp. AN-B15]QXE08589.1 hypothetical protein GTQ41_05830 [Pseudomonas sp. AN-B15]